ncbi:MAG: peroxiredoxin [Gammaproteobacteria bacterium]
MNNLTRKCLTVLLSLISSASLAAPGIGDPAPAFRLQDQNGDWQALEDYRGQWVTVYFYPKDDTPGCTVEAQAFRDNIDAYNELGIVVMGISLDDVISHEAFAQKYNLPFSILADADKTTAKDYGVYTKVATFEMAKRETFIIGPDGKVAKHYPLVNPSTHSKEVLKDLRGMINAGTS